MQRDTRCRLLEAGLDILSDNAKLLVKKMAHGRSEIVWGQTIDRGEMKLQWPRIAICAIADGFTLFLRVIQAIKAWMYINLTRVILQIVCQTVMFSQTEYRPFLRTINPQHLIYFMASSKHGTEPLELFWYYCNALISKCQSSCSSPRHRM